MEILPIGARFEPTSGQRSMLEQSGLSEKDFLQVLVAQLRNQNPLKPKDDGEFISQLAQFDQLRSLNKINATLQAFSQLSMLGQASSLLGREVVAASPTTGGTITGVVESIEVAEGVPYLKVAGERIGVTAVHEVHPL